MANLLLSMMGAFAEFERALIRERQREGIALAKQRGAYRGRKKSLAIDQIDQLRRRYSPASSGSAERRSINTSAPRPRPPDVWSDVRRITWEPRCARESAPAA